MPRSRRFSPTPSDRERISELYGTLGYKETAALLDVPLERVRRWKAGKGTLSQANKTALKNAYDSQDFYFQVVRVARDKGNTHAYIADALRKLANVPGLGDHPFKKRRKRGKTLYDYAGKMPLSRRRRVVDIFGSLGIPPSGIGAIYKRKGRR